VRHGCPRQEAGEGGPLGGRGPGGGGGHDRADAARRGAASGGAVQQFQMSVRMHRLAIATLAGIAIATPAAAQDFYRGKTITIMVGFSPGGGFDINARVLARHLGRHIPGNPAVVVQNMPGAGTITSVHYLDLVAPKDGTVLDIFNFGNIGESRLNPDKVKVDFRKFNWIGSI